MQTRQTRRAAPNFALIGRHFARRGSAGVLVASLVSAGPMQQRGRRQHQQLHHNKEQRCSANKNLTCFGHQSVGTPNPTSTTSVRRIEFITQFIPRIIALLAVRLSRQADSDARQLGSQSEIRWRKTGGPRRTPVPKTRLAAFNVQSPVQSRAPTPYSPRGPRFASLLRV